MGKDSRTIYLLSTVQTHYVSGRYRVPSLIVFVVNEKNFQILLTGWYIAQFSEFHCFHFNLVFISIYLKVR